jgi:hypothetical protein
MERAASLWRSKYRYLVVVHGRRGSLAIAAGEPSSLKSSLANPAMQWSRQPLSGEMTPRVISRWGERCRSTSRHSAQFERSKDDEELVGVQEIMAFQGNLVQKAVGVIGSYIGYGSMAKRNFCDRPLKCYQLCQWM